MASQEDRAAVLNALRPIFPQLNGRIIEESIDIVRQTVGEVRELLIPGCIDYLLERNSGNNQQRNGQNHDVPIVVEDEVTRRPAGALKRKRISDLEVSFVEDIDDNELMYVATSIQDKDKRVYMIDDSPPSSSTEDCFIVPKSRCVVASKKDATQNVHNSTQNNGSTSAISITSNNDVNLDPLNCSIKRIKSLFPDVQETFLKDLIEKWKTFPADVIVTNACNELLEKSYPKEENKSQSVSVDHIPKTKVDYLKNYSSFPSNKYIEQCLALLENEFPKFTVNDIRAIARKHYFHYAPTRKYLEEKLLEAYNLLSTKKNSTEAKTLDSITSGQSSKPPLRLMKGKRQQRNLECLRSLDKELQKEMDFIKNYKMSQEEEKDRQMAFTLNEEQYEAEGQMIECGCCYVEATFEDMVQCLDGHLFCVNCLRSYAKEAVFGQGKAVLSCMTSDCYSTFPMTQLQRSLDSNILSKYEDRLAEESICLAEMDDLVRCPHCDFAAIMAQDDKVFKCQNTACLKETCRYCKEEWEEHFGLKCSEVEKNDEKNMRLSYEEKMTMAKIRKCHKCGCEFTKSDGCNKMTCRCGTTMCYICRKPSISYNHFCQHPRDPGQRCKICTSCSLWSDPSEDDDMAVKQIEQEAKEAKSKLAATVVTPSKKLKTSNQDTSIQTINLVHTVL